MKVCEKEASGEYESQGKAKTKGRKWYYQRTFGLLGACCV